MNTREFEKIVYDRLDVIKATLSSKGDEYARGDRFSNFKKAAKLLGVTPEKALLGFVTKHIVALVDFIDDLDQGNLQSQEQFDEKIGDIIAYMLLLEGMVVERHQSTSDFPTPWEEMAAAEKRMDVRRNKQPIVVEGDEPFVKSQAPPEEGT